MKYINRENGAIIDTPCFIYGKYWELLEEKKEATEEEKKEATEKEKKEATEENKKKKTDEKSKRK